jgi:hypothetical protein
MPQTVPTMSPPELQTKLTNLATPTGEPSTTQQTATPSDPLRNRILATSSK